MGSACLRNTLMIFSFSSIFFYSLSYDDEDQEVDQIF